MLQQAFGLLFLYPHSLRFPLPSVAVPHANHAITNPSPLTGAPPIPSHGTPVSRLGIQYGYCIAYLTYADIIAPSPPLVGCSGSIISICSK